MAKVGLAYNLIHFSDQDELPFDRMAELDSSEAIQAIEDALKSDGHEVILLEADQDFCGKLQTTRPEIVFNIAEGLNGENREAYVPSICESLGIPYTGSGVQTLTTCLNKAQTNAILSANQMTVPPFQVFFSPDDHLELDQDFPLIIKLLHEGSSMGLSRKSVVDNKKNLRDQVDFLISTYHEPALVQKFIMGREFTVGILGNQNPTVLPITEVTFQDPYGIVVFSFDDEVVPLIKHLRGENFWSEFNKSKIPYQTVCPAKISAELTDRIQRTSVRAFNTLGCRDWCRIDLRLGNDNQLYILELNPIAGIAPGYWLPNSAQAANLDYPAFINGILAIAWERIHDNHA